MYESDTDLISLLCLSTGARWGESQHIVYTDLNNSSAVYSNTKSKKPRTVPVSSSLYNLLITRLRVGKFTDSYSTFTRRLPDSMAEV